MSSNGTYDNALIVATAAASGRRCQLQQFQLGHAKEH
jgi:hypothetical protein